MEGTELRDQLVKMLKWEDAHSNLETALEDLPEELLGVIAPAAPYSIWQLLEHIRITQADILDFCINPNYKEMKWPENYWPKEVSSAKISDLKKSVQSFISDRKKMINLVADTSNDLLKPFPHGNGQNLLREVLLLADHTSYHIGQLILIRKILGNW